MPILLENLNTAEHQAATEAGQAFIEHLVDVESVRALAAPFGVELPKDFEAYPTARKLTWLKGFSNIYLDTRNGKLREHVDLVEFSPDQKVAIIDEGRRLDMTGETNASRDDYGIIEVPGGAGESNIKRTRHAREQLERGVKAPYTVILGSRRKITEKEKAAAAYFAPNAETEYDLLVAGFEYEFGKRMYREATFGPDGKPADPSDPNAGTVRFIELPEYGTQVLITSAPCVEGRNGNANTTDTHNFIGAILGEERYRELKSVLLVTTDVFVPFQTTDAIRLLGLYRDLAVEGIGYDGGPRTEQQFANEINAAINKAYKLNEEFERLADYKQILAHPTVHELTGRLRSVPERSVMVGKIMLYVAEKVIERRAELNAVLDQFRTRRLGMLTASEMENQMHWQLMSDLEHDEPNPGGPEYVSPYLFAATRGLRLVEPASQDPRIRGEAATILEQARLYEEIVDLESQLQAYGSVDSADPPIFKQAHDQRIAVLEQKLATLRARRQAIASTRDVETAEL